jgi:hypothetical protein
MEIRVLVIHAGETRWNAGDVVDVPLETAAAMLARGEAEAIAKRAVDRAEKRPRGATKETR